MKTEKIIQMIDEYLEEPHSINKDWVQALEICRQALLDKEKLKAEIERLNKEVDRLSQCVMYHDGQIADAIKDFAERLKVKFMYDESAKKAIDRNLKEMGVE